MAKKSKIAEGSDPKKDFTSSFYDIDMSFAAYVIDLGIVQYQMMKSLMNFW
jgi:hypothetical protein